MKKLASRGLPAHLPRRRSAPISSLESLLDKILAGGESGRGWGAGMRKLAGEVFHLDGRGCRVVVLGGGTGMSTVVGGNSSLPDWSLHPFVGLKQVFPDLHLVVCTTDDGGSTGRLVRCVPMIGIGDMRKSLLSLIRQDLLRRTYPVNDKELLALIQLIQQVFNYRFTEEARGFALLQDPLRLVSPLLRQVCPPVLAARLRALGRYISPGGGGPVLPPAGHCMGNLLLASAILRAAGGRASRPPGVQAVRTGVDAVARLIGAPPGHLHAATVTPGELVFRYANGVEVTGQSKSSYAKRGFPVDEVRAEFSAAPKVPRAILRVLQAADLILIAPGSLYTSNITLLQVPGIPQAIRANRRALKILGANFWVQEGETDISPRDDRSGFLVSELIEAYDRNVPGGARGLFDVVLASNLEHLPGDILRNYALEGKSPIHLDRARVEAMGFTPVEATLFRADQPPLPGAVQHDPEKFALAIRALRVWDRHAPLARAALRGAKESRPASRSRSLAPACYMSRIEAALRGKRFEPAGLRDIVLDLAWKNRDIRPEHLRCFRGAHVISAARWNRSVEWDNVLGYFDPEDLMIKLHASRLKQPDRLCEDMVIALGEAVLGRYIARRVWSDDSALARHAARSYAIYLLPPSRRISFLEGPQLARYLRLARMNPCPGEPGCWCVTVNGEEGFLPPGLLFGMMYAWYLNNAWGGAIEYEMSLLKWPPETLLPYQVREKARKQALVDFFRTEVFRR